VLALASCAAAKKTPEQATELTDLGLPAVRAALEFPAGASDVTLGWLVDELARLSAQELTMVPHVRQQLDVSREPLEITTPVPAREVYAYVEGMLAAQGMLIAPVKGGERPVLGIYSAARRGPESGEPSAVHVELGEVEALAGHPALLCQVMLVLENIDSRQLQTQLRQLLADASGTQLCVPAGERGLLLQSAAGAAPTQPAMPEKPTASRPAGQR
jgi:hypothetical protein